MAFPGTENELESAAMTQPFRLLLVLVLAIAPATPTALAQAPAPVGGLPAPAGGRGGGLAPVRIGPPALVPPEVTIPRPTQGELEQVNAA